MADQEKTPEELRAQVVTGLRGMLQHALDVAQGKVEEVAAAEAAVLAKAEGRKFNPGDKVRFKGEYLRNTGQHAGGEGTKKFTVQEHKDCHMCARGSHVAVDQPNLDNDGPRHIAVAHLEKTRSKLDKAEGDLAKVTPPDVSEELAHKIKRQYPGDKSKAYATMWSIHHKLKGRHRKPVATNKAELAKTTTAGGGDVAPSARVDSAALSKEKLGKAAAVLDEAKALRKDLEKGGYGVVGTPGLAGAMRRSKAAQGAPAPAAPKPPEAPKTPAPATKTEKAESLEKGGYGVIGTPGLAGAMRRSKAAQVPAAPKPAAPAAPAPAPAAPKPAMAKNAAMGYGADLSSGGFGMAEKAMPAPKMPGLTPPPIPGKPKPDLGMDQANAQLSRFKSIASNPTAMPAGRTSLHRPVGMGKAEMCKSCGAAHSIPGLHVKKAY